MNTIIYLYRAVDMVTPGNLIMMKDGSLGLVVSVQRPDDIPLSGGRWTLHVLWKGKVTVESCDGRSKVKSL
jgi:hypothetical protein